VAMDRYPDPIGRRSQCATNGKGSLLAMITFLGQRVDITGPPQHPMVDVDTSKERWIAPLLATVLSGP